jgi:hypothetical protein
MREQATPAEPLTLNFAAQDFIGLLMAVMTESGIRSLKVTKHKSGEGYRYEATAERGKDIRDAYAARLDFDVDADGITLRRRS